ncbi:MAG: hypothetical protein GY835_01315 [bacterium]|nr:hypothetical protein [bacterium]
MRRKVLIPAILLNVLVSVYDLNATQFSFSKKDLKEAAHLLEIGTIEGSMQTVRAPAAALLLFPQLTHEFNRIERTMRENERLRLQPKSVADVVNSYELDIIKREEFNVILREFRQVAGKLKERFENLDHILTKERDDLEEEAIAFRTVAKIIAQEVSLVVSDPEIRHLRISWPNALPKEVTDVLDRHLVQLLATEDLEARTIEWSYLDRTLRRLRTSHQIAYEQALRDMEMQRKIVKHEPERVFKEIGFMIAYCIEKNREANERSEHMRWVVLGEGPSQDSLGKEF